MTILFGHGRKQSKKRQHEQTRRRHARRMRERRRQRRRQQPTPRRTPPSPPATSRVRATSCSWTRSAATRTTIRASACPSVATPSRTRWALSPRTSPPPPTRTTTHAAPGRSAWWVCAATHSHSLTMVPRDPNTNKPSDSTTNYVWHLLSLTATFVSCTRGNITKSILYFIYILKSRSLLCT